MKQKRRILTAIGAAVLAVAVMATSLDVGMKEVSAATRLYGVQQIVEDIGEDNPFTILEIVPDELYSSMEAYVDASQFVISPDLLMAENSAGAREESVLSYLIDVAAESQTSDADDYPMAYNTATLYQEQLSAPADMTGWQVLTFEDEYFEERRGSYVQTGAGSDYTATEVDVKEEVTDEATGEITEIVTKVTVYEYTPGTGTYSWVDDLEADTVHSVEIKNLYYKINLTSNYWFANYVLETTDTDNIDVVAVTPAMLQENLINGYLAMEGERKILNWGEIDFLYISNTGVLNLSETQMATLDAYQHMSNGTEGNDISWETAYAIYEYVKNANLPVMLDATVIPTLDDASMTAALNADNNLLRLAYLLRDYTIATDISEYGFVTDATTGDVTWNATTSAAAVMNTQAMGTMGSVQGSVYVDSFTDTTLGKMNLVSTEFPIVFQTTTATAKDDSYIKGMTQIADEINTENFYNDTHGAGYTTEYSEDGNIQMSQATLVKYILNYAHRRIALYKDKITVLDVEPTKYSTLTEETVKGWLDDGETESKIHEINIVQTSTSEFIGKVEDLNEEYDLIYFGSCIGGSKMNGSMKQSSGQTTYRDTSMNGLIYSHVGDIGEAVYEYAGLLTGEVNGYQKNSVISRFSGNDITKEKMEDLMAFVDAGYPVVISDNLFKSDNKTINPERVDNSSYIYQFMSAYTGTSMADNVMNDSNITATTLARYINMPKLYISMISQPTEYDITYVNNSNKSKIDSVSYLEAVGDKYNLNYTFELSDTSEVASDSTLYHVQLFIDTNADGQYTSMEEMDGLIVTEDNGGREVPVNELVTGVRYTVSRELPADYEGMLPWKLQVSMTVPEGEESTVRTTATGYTAVKAGQVDIKILQINSNSGVVSLKNNDNFETLFDDLKDKMNYDITIDEITVKDYVGTVYNRYVGKETDTDKAAKLLYDSYFKNYDMLILGFDDCYTDISSEGATKAIKMFIESGRSVLFSHDTTSHINAKDMPALTYWGYYLNQYIRSLVGMDRYGITETDLAFLKKGNDLAVYADDPATPEKELSENIQDIQNLNKDIAYAPKGNGETTTHEVHGFSNFALSRSDFSTNSNDLYYTDKGNYKTNTITQLNEGQITTFPYPLNLENDATSREYNTSGSTKYWSRKYNKMSVAQTHGQYYQLDLQLDKSGDGVSDIVVWYALSDNIYDAMPNDARNNYYIYSVGNVTYTGMGHNGSITMDEAKLFVNTMVASYQSGKRNPSLSIVSSATDKNKQVNYIYRTFDESIQNLDSLDENIYFYVNDTNIINGTKTIKVKYYCEASEAAVVSDDTEIIQLNENGETLNLQLMGTTQIEGVSVARNNMIEKAVLDAEWINAQLASSSSVKVYIGVQTELDYIYENRENETTEEVFTYVTIRRRDMFNLD